MKFSFIVGLLILSFVIFLMAISGSLLEMILQYPFSTFVMSGVLLYGIGFLFDYVFFSNTRLRDNLSYFLAFLAVWSVVTAVVFMSLIPPLNLATIRIIFRPIQNCNAFNNPPKYLCYTLDDNNNQLFYTTLKQECVGNNKNASSFYIISLWKPALNQFKLNKRIMFYPLPKDEKTKYPLKKGYCIQAAENLNADDQVKVDFYSWDKEKMLLQDTGFINRSDLEEYNTGWYQVSNCMLETSRLISRYLLKDYCITGFVSSFYVNVPEHMKNLLHVKEQ